MSELAYEKKLNFILEIAEKFQITAYEIGTKAKLNVSGIERILDKTVKKPHEKTVNKIFGWLETQEKYANYITQNIIKDPSPTYTTVPQLQTRVKELEEKNSLKDRIIDLLTEQIELMKVATKNKSEEN